MKSLLYACRVFGALTFGLTIPQDALNADFCR